MTDVFTSSLADRVGVSATTDFATIVLSESVDSGLATDVELVAEGGGADVEPVGVVGTELTSRGSLDPLCPLKQTKLIILIIAEITHSACYQNEKSKYLRQGP